MKNLLRLFMILFVFVLYSCSDKQDEQKYGNFMLKFDHKADGKPLIFDSMCYVNAANNPYEINEIMYFISSVTLHYQNGDEFLVDPLTPIHFVNPDLEQTLSWYCNGIVPVGNCDSITFTFGLSDKDNHSNIFVNPPEVNMAWPEALGGGYHYMMMNGFYKDSNGVRKTNNFHLGRGQIYDENHQITGYVDNSFTVKPEGSTFKIAESSTTTAVLTMNIESWFTTPVIYDFNVWGGAIMQNQAAMNTACKNGSDAFSINYSYQ